jgi:hypothetical protein
MGAWMLPSTVYGGLLAFDFSTGKCGENRVNPVVETGKGVLLKTCGQLWINRKINHSLSAKITGFSPQ